MDIESIKQDFPILKQRVNDEPLTYLDSAATAQMPTPVLKAIEHYYQHDHANVHRGTHTLAQRATAAYETARQKPPPLSMPSKLKKSFYAFNNGKH